MKQGRRVVVTGIGIVSSLGIGKTDFLSRLKNGISGFRPISLFDVSGLKCKLAGEIYDLNFEQYIGNNIYWDRSTKLLLIAAKLALEDARIEEINNRSDVGIVIGTVFGDIHSTYEFDRVSLSEGPMCVSPMLFANTIINSPASQLSIRHGIKGLNITISSGFAASTDAIAYSTELIRTQRAEVLIAGGAESLSLETYLGFYLTGLLSGSKVNEEEFCAPFDSKRNGIMLGEGSSVLVLESLEHAVARNANIITEVIGCGSAFGPGKEGVKRAMCLALQDANIKPNEIDYICASANGSIKQDKIAAEAIGETFHNAPNVLIGSIASIVGDCYGASGAMQVATGCLSVSHDVAPPTLNFHELDSNLALLNIQDKKIEQKINTVMATSCGCDGNNSSVIVRKYFD